MWSSGFSNDAIPVQLGTATWQKVECLNHSVLGIQADGSLWIWGGNSDGEFGNGITGSPQYTPVQIGTDTDWADVHIGLGSGPSSLYYCTKTDGSVWVWGSNELTQYGNGLIGGGYTNITQLPMHCVTTLATPTFTKEAISLYPNPANNEVSISYSELPKNTKAYLYDQTGRLVANQELKATGSTTIAINHLQTGIYIMVLKQNATILEQYKLIKQ